MIIIVLHPKYYIEKNIFITYNAYDNNMFFNLLWFKKNTYFQKYFIKIPKT